MIMGEPADSKGPLLEIDRVSVTLHRPGASSLPLVRDATLEVRAGEIVVLVGESGSGKSVTVRTLMGLMQLDGDVEVGGSIRVDGVELSTDDQFGALRGRDLAMVFQEPMSSLDPVFTVGSQLTEALRRRERLDRPAERERLRELLREVGISDPDRVLRSYPHQLSGGMCQRVMIAAALAARPRLLLADEPTTALDVTIQAQILDLIDRLRIEADLGVLLVTHDLGVAAEVADRVVVMYAGRVVETAAPAMIFTRPAHPYTQGLLGSIPLITGPRPDRLPAIDGSVPDPGQLPSGCAFHPRCPRADARCAVEDPPVVAFGDSTTACWHPGQPSPVVAVRDQPPAAEHQDLATGGLQKAGRP
jgi:oligopeptide/dipeptide ABC transporter ATP-binding protein